MLSCVYMKIYVSHATQSNYEDELYAPLKQTIGKSHELVLPHDVGADVHSKDAIRSSDLVLAEVSHPSTGQGIELGWADDAGIPIICIHRLNEAPSGALKYITKQFVTYRDSSDIGTKLDAVLSK